LRWQQHKSELRNNRHKNRHLQAAWNKYGEKVFKFQRLEYCSVERLNEREQHFLDIYIAKGVCYNIAPEVGTTRGLHHSEEAKQKLREFNTGRHHTIETRQRMRIAKVGTKQSKESIEKREITQARKRQERVDQLQSEVVDPLWWLEKWKMAHKDG
jgi:group I intron endonuclease